MSTASLRTRVTVLTLSVLVLVLVGALAAVTLAYRSSLQRDLRHRLAAGASGFRDAWPGPSAKQLITNLALEGIETDVEGGPAPPLAAKGEASGKTPTKPGTDITASGSLLVLHEVLPDGTRASFSASSGRIDRAVNRLLIVEVAVALAALALAALLLLRGTATALRPLANVAQTAMQIAAGDTSRRLRPTRTDTELGAMAAAFDQMVDALEAAVATAQNAEAAMRRFLADASHELRTPVAALQATAETLLREQPRRPQRDAIEAGLAREAARLGRLVADLLGLARLEASEPARHERVDLAAIAGAAIEQARLHSPGAQISLDLCDGALVSGDADGLTRCIRNLLDNALAAVQPGGRIELAVQQGAGQVEVRVADDGPGIPSSERERIFERFVRLGTSSAPAGTGLGLAIARRIARQHGGDLTCDPIPHGACFTLRLPLNAEDPSTPGAPRA